VRANTQQFVAELDSFRDELACRFFVNGGREQEYWRDGAILDAGRKLGELVGRHGSRLVVHDPEPIGECLDWLPEVRSADLSNWACFLIMIKCMQLRAQGPSAPLVDEMQVLPKLSEAVREMRNEPMSPSLPVQAFFMLCDALGARAPKLRTVQVLCLGLHDSVDRLLRSESPDAVADCCESLATKAMQRLAQQRR
jgi:hypothetical protein